MARARMLKPGFFANEVLAECDPLARMLFQGLWLNADREGRLEDRPKRLKAEILPYDDCDVDALLLQLCERDFIIRYEAQGTKCIQIVSFAKHQNPHPKEPPSTLPGIESRVITRLEISVPEPVTEVPEPTGPLPIPSSSYSPFPIPETRTSALAASKRVYDEEFSKTFWPAYPHKVGKGDAILSFRRARQHAELSEIMDGLARYMASKPPDRSWCNPSTFLNQTRWLDEPAPIVANGNSYGRKQIPDPAARYDNPLPLYSSPRGPPPRL